MIVEPEGIAAYLRVRAGQSKAGRGVYERRRPFVHLRFHGVDGALAVMNKEVGFVDGVAKGFVTRRRLARVRRQLQRLHAEGAGAADRLTLRSRQRRGQATPAAPSRSRAPPARAPR